MTQNDYESLRSLSSFCHGEEEVVPSGNNRKHVRCVGRYTYMRQKIEERTMRRPERPKFDTASRYSIACCCCITGSTCCDDCGIPALPMPPTCGGRPRACSSRDAMRRSASVSRSAAPTSRLRPARPAWLASSVRTSDRSASRSLSIATSDSVVPELPRAPPADDDDDDGPAPSRNRGLSSSCAHASLCESITSLCERTSYTRT